jgi:hypothetical protein
MAPETQILFSHMVQIFCSLYIVIILFVVVCHCVVAACGLTNLGLNVVSAWWLYVFSTVIT